MGTWNTELQEQTAESLELTDLPAKGNVELKWSDTLSQNNNMKSK